MTNIDLDKLEAVARKGNAYLLQCIEGFADGYFGSADEIDASHAKHFAEDLVESIEFDVPGICTVEAAQLSALIAELRGAKATIAHMTQAMSWISGHDRAGLDHLDEAMQMGMERDTAEAGLREARATIERVRELGDELASAPMVGSSSEEQWELDTQRGCGRSILAAVDGEHA